MTAPRVYFDNAATTPIDPRVREVMLRYLGPVFGNPDSRSHPYGWEADEAVTIAREQIAGLLGAAPDEIIFTGSATEANNLALFGVFPPDGRSPGHLVITAIEHSALLEPARELRRRGVEVAEIPPDSHGRIDPARVREALREDTRLVSVQHANNEIGVIQDLRAIGEIAAERGVLFHTDASQSFGKIGIEVPAWGVHLLSCSAHKVYGPKGVGALYVRRRAPRVSLSPSLHGGGQEHGLRPGTLNVPGIAGFGEAARIAAEEMAADAARVAPLRDRLETGVLASVSGARANGAGAARLPGITNLTFPGMAAESLILGLRGVACSAGSACASSRLEPSHVLLALGLAPAEARNSLRFSLGRFNTAAEVERVIQETLEVAARLRMAGGDPAGEGADGDPGARPA